MDLIKFLTDLLLNRELTHETAKDEQTGASFVLIKEKLFDVLIASLSFLYLIAAIVFLGWFLIDFFTKQSFLVPRFVAADSPLLKSDTFKAVVCAAAGGFLGGVLNGFRSIMYWHLDKKAFLWRYFWKYIVFPILGAGLAFSVYVILHSGSAILGMSIDLEEKYPSIRFSCACAVGILCGLGNQKVFKWLDACTDNWLKTYKQGQNHT